jgi:hypothetical protein
MVKGRERGLLYGTVMQPEEAKQALQPIFLGTDVTFWCK